MTSFLCSQHEHRSTATGRNRIGRCLSHFVCSMTPNGRRQTRETERETTQHMSLQMSKCDYCCIRPSSVSINCARCSPLRSMKICGQCSIHVNQVREHSKLHPMSTYEVRGKAGRGGATRTRTSVHSSCWTFLWMIDRSVNGCVATKSI